MVNTMLENPAKLQLNTKLITYIQWAVFILTVIAIFLYPLLPDKKITIIPSDETWVNLNTVGNGIEISWIDRQKDHWQCTIKENIGRSSCGVYLTWRDELLMRGRDLSNFKNIKLNIDYQGNAKRIRLYLRNFDGDYANTTDHNSSQYLYTEFRQDDLNHGDLEIALTEITVADWWLDQYQHPRKNALPKFDKVHTFGIEIYGDNIAGTHKVMLNSIEFIGPAINERNYYFTILIIWLVGVFLHLITQLYIAKKYVITVKTTKDKLAKFNKVLAQEKDKYRELSVLDALTQIPNRHGFEEFMLNDIKATSKDVSLIMLDIDFFKKINDTHGHDIGDVALKELSALLQENIRSNDFFARWGGEEFVICCIDTTLHDAYKFSEKLRTIVEKAVFCDEFQLKMTISLGIAMRNPKESFKEWFSYADQALYQAKADGRNKTVSM